MKITVRGNRILGGRTIICLAYGICCQERKRKGMRESCVQFHSEYMEELP